MDGIINVLKPVGMTSADIVRWISRITKEKKAGHIGTLDPGAAGVLPICIGKATRLAEYHSGQGKYYRAEITLGITTDTQDAFGEEITKEVPDISPEKFREALKKFRGDIEQLPPMYSAVRKNGKHLYEFARQGLEVARTKRSATIYKLEMINWQEADFPRALIDIECSKGTYIRTLCQDIGEELGCGAHMSFLLRLRAGQFTLDTSYTLEEIERAVSKGDNSFILDLDWGLELQEVKLPPDRLNAFKCGLPTGGSKIRSTGCEDNQTVKVSCEGQFIGIGIWREGCLYPSKVFC